MNRSGKQMMDKEEMKKQIEQLDKEIDSMIHKKCELQEEYFKLYKLDDIKKKYLNKYFIYRDNKYYCSKKKSDYWNVYYKVINVDENGGIIALELQKDIYGLITCRETMIGVDPLNLEEITEKEYIRETSKILKELQERYK